VKRIRLDKDTDQLRVSFDNERKGFATYGEFQGHFKVKKRRRKGVQRIYLVQYTGGRLLCKKVINFRAA
jgi:hypothetical protein